MSNPTELWFKEPVTIFLLDGSEADGVNVVFVRYLDDNESFEDVDTFKEFEDLMGGTVLGSLYEVVTFPDGKKGYVEVEEYDDYGSSCDYEFVTDPFEDGVMV